MASNCSEENVQKADPSLHFQASSLATLWCSPLELLFRRFLLHLQGCAHAVPSTWKIYRSNTSFSSPYLQFLPASSSLPWDLSLEDTSSRKPQITLPWAGYVVFMFTVHHGRENNTMNSLSAITQPHWMMEYHQIFPQCSNSLINNLNRLFESRSWVHTLQDNTQFFSLN